MKSITRQLLIGLLGGMLACTLIAGIAAYVNTYDEAGELFDLQLEQLAAALPDRFSADASLPEDDPEDEFVIQAWDEKGTALYASSAELALPRFTGTGFDTVSAHGERWRLYRESRRGRFVQIAQPTSVREELAADLALGSLVPFLLLIPAVAVLIGIVVYRSLTPLRRAAHDVAQRSPSALHPLPADRLPPEVQPIIIALNDLMNKLDKALQSQRAFVADAAHELRSPLAALKLQLPLAERAATPEQRAIAFRKLHDRLDRSTRLVQQLLTLARQDPDIEHLEHGDVDLCQLARQVVADYRTLAESRKIHLSCSTAAQPVVVQGSVDQLRTMSGNLVDNAIRYTPAGGEVDLEVMRANDDAALRVTDNGPGIPEEDHLRVFDRFYRCAGSRDTGSGLGLAIVKSIAQQHGATLSLDRNPAGAGLMVTVRFDAARAERRTASGAAASQNS